MVGGYKILDFGGVNVPTGGTGVKVPGIYDRVESNTSKPFLLRNLSVIGKDLNPRFAYYDTAGANYRFPIGPDLTTGQIRYIIIKSDDYVAFDRVTA